MTALKISNVRKSFGGTVALDDINLVVKAGSFAAIVGPSGSGKTTLLRVIAGFESASGGTVRIGDSVVDAPGVHVAPEKRHLGYVPQEGALFPHLNVADNVGFGLARQLRKGPKAKALLDLVGLSNLDHRFPHELSGGQQQRVALARALALEPALILLDEPFASLDASLRNSMRADVSGVLRASQATVLLVTHDQNEALSMADEVTVLRNGLIAQSGTPDDLYVRPIDPSLAMFLGEANLVAGTVANRRAQTALGVFDVNQPDGEAVVLVRPEAIALTTNETQPGLAGTVMQCDYFGHDSLLRVRPDVSCGVEALIVRVHNSTRYKPDDRVWLRATVSSAQCWPA